MAEQGIARMAPMLERAWDPKGVAAMRALADYHTNPEDHLVNSSLITPEAVVAMRAKINVLHTEVCGTINGEATATERSSSRRSPSRLDICSSCPSPTKTLQKVEKLATAYESLSECRYVRSYSAHRRLRPVGEYQTPVLLQAYYVVFPCVMFACCFAIQSLLLHLATHFYVYYMTVEIIKGDFQEPGHARLFDLIGSLVSNSTDGSSEGATFYGSVKVPMPVLDASGTIPAMLCFVSYVYAWLKGQFSIGLWNKTFIVASCMAILKGILDVVTIMPDSIGWEMCKARLGGDEGVANMLNMSFANDTSAAVWRLFQIELFGDDGGKRVRYCADMMVSGHTYFAALFSLSAYKQTYYTGVGKIVANLVGLLCACCMVAEVVLVAAARFHYTVDMLAALALVGLLFDSSYVDQLAADWSEGFRWQDMGSFEPASSPVFKRILLPCCRRLCRPGGGQKPAIIPSRATGLVNPRVTLGHPPWVWRTAADLEQKEKEQNTMDGI
mmetsp:Transcript_119713/g.346012  ORF Transcript_119713/g.346012 Transcript_119713/m.346012 type:complete len:499 (+) Transcript_119713:44-1540(+)